MFRVGYGFFNVIEISLDFIVIKSFESNSEESSEEV
jgi:hypothetical protein